MMNLPPDIKITDYIPDWDEIPTSVLRDARDRLVLYTQSGMPDLDTAPGSTFGDLHINPLAHLLAAIEIAANRMFSDLDLANVAAGTIWNCPYTKRFLANFGVHTRASVQSSGVIQVLFSKPATYIIRETTAFSINGFQFRLRNQASALVISPNHDGHLLYDNFIQLRQISDTMYFVNIPVVGDAGIKVAAKDVCTIDTFLPNILSITALSDFDSGLSTASVSEIADLVPRTFYAASMNSRAGIQTFMLLNFPELVGISSILSGDEEMLRDRQNILGINEGKVDIYTKGKTIFTSSSDVLELTYNENDGNPVFQGLISIPETPIVWIDGFLKSTSGNNVDAQTLKLEGFQIIGKSTDYDRFPGLSAAFSNHEMLAVTIPAEDLMDVVIPSKYGATTDGDVAGFVFTITGAMVGNKFLAASRDYKVEVGTIDIVNNAVVMNFRDTATNTVYPVEFSSDGTTATVNPLDPNYIELFNGLSMTIQHPNNVTSFGDDPVFDVSVKGITAKVVMQYRFDPTFSSVEQFINHPDSQSVNVDAVAKVFHTCYVTEIVVNYRIHSGQIFDHESARAEILKYVNSIVYPNVYEESIIMEIALFYGAKGVQSITQQGKCYTSLANIYERADQTEENVPAHTTSTLNLSNLGYGSGARNVAYILDAENIKFNGKVI